MPKKQDLPERFWSKVEIGLPDECWEWQASRNHKGYGTFQFSTHSLLKAHRVSWLLVNGLIPDNTFVLHKCDNRCCVNPNHLYLGDNSDNMRDMYSRGRKDISGPNHPNTRITWDIAKKIRELGKLNLSARKITLDLGLTSEITTRKILRNQIWIEKEVTK